MHNRRGNCIKRNGTHNSKEKTMKKFMPLIAIRDTVIFPHNRIPIFVARARSQKALEAALAGNKTVFFATQKRKGTENPSFNDLYGIGCIGIILQSVKDASGGYKILAEGIERAKLTQLDDNSIYWQAEVEPLPLDFPATPKHEAAITELIETFKNYIDVAGKLPKDVIDDMLSIRDPVKVIYLILGYLPAEVFEKQKLLAENDAMKLMMKLIKILTNETEFLRVKKDIHEKVHREIQKNQREYFLSEEMKAIERELKKDGPNKEYNDYIKKIKESGMPPAAEKQAKEELERLTKMMPFSPEATVVRTYLDWMVAMPWKKTTADMLDIKHVQKILEDEHWGLKKAKERVVEYLAVCKLNKKIKGPILCFVGPPGTGKTSFARSIAKALGRKFARISLGGVRDEAEIRGHRKTYIGAMPGKIIQSIRKAGSKNPVFLIDEVDKIGQDFRGDPSSALLEVLDPEQNNTFADHYLNVPFDLSDVMFITTANTTYSIIPALRDRMEVIEFPSYTEEEKIGIAKNFLIPKQMKENGLEKVKIEFGENAVKKIIKSYTQEAGVRNLERQIATVLRKIAKNVVEKNKKGKITVDEKMVSKLLGYEKILKDEGKKNDIGSACGLAWTETGGEVIIVEAVVMKGKGTIILTGQLGDVMKESAQTALSYLRANAAKFAIAENFLKDKDIHIHVPEGAIPKDGPSAGVTMATALLSRITGKPVRKGIAMTGEITLTGRVLPVGGIKEKILAAYRQKIEKVIIPEKNIPETSEIPKKIRENLKIIPVKNIEEVIQQAIEPKKRKKNRIKPQNFSARKALKPSRAIRPPAG
ncbi:MAG: endopeptidase La [Elusimicrobia bacterium]|nr:endopeptidase La [Elusimicrobiota bacterium]